MYDAPGFSIPTKKLDNIVKSVLRAAQFSRTYAPTAADDENAVMCVTPGEIQNGVILSSLPLLQKKPEYRQFKLENGNLLIFRSGNKIKGESPRYKTVAFEASYYDKTVIANGGLFVIREYNKESYYLKAFFDSPAAQRILFSGDECPSHMLYASRLRNLSIP